MRRTVATVGWLTLVWMALWEEITWANLIGGVLAGGFVILLIPLRPLQFAHEFRPLAFLKLALYFAWKLTQASAVLAWEVLTPRNRINAAVIAIPLKTRSPRIATFVANMNSLIPGTLTLEVVEETMTLISHVLHLESVEEGRREILYLEQLTMAAFPERATEGAA